METQAHPIALTGLPMAFTLDICMVLVSFVTACVAWVRWANADWRLQRKYMPRHHVNESIYYWTTEYHTLESWNCVLARNTAFIGHHSA